MKKRWGKPPASVASWDSGRASSTVLEGHPSMELPWDNDREYRDYLWTGSVRIR